MKRLHVSNALTLPPEAVTATFGLLAVRGAGKSNAGAVMAEEMFAAGLPFVAIDPVGSWPGLRAGADGKPAGGIPIPIFGGRSGDVPLERGAGELVADLIAEQRLSCVLDLSEFASEGDKKAFLLSFARRLYQKNRDPLHLFLEEADDYIPQKPIRDELQLLRAWENIVRRGRSRGLGMTIISQRSAVVNKNVLTQVETLFVLRTTGPQDLAAIEAWTKHHQVGTELLASLAGLEDGEAWVWSPHFLHEMKRFRFRKRATFDSGATPQNVRGRDARKVATLADVDLGAIKTRMAETIERAEADDPVALRRRIVELEKALTGALRAKEQPAQVLVPMFDKELLREVEADVGLAMNNIRASLHRYTSKLLEKSGAKPGTTVGAPLSAREATPRRLPEAIQPRTGPTLKEKSARAANGAGDPSIGGGLRRMMIALAQRPQGLTNRQLGVRAGLLSNSGTFSTYLSRARSQGWIRDEGPKRIITDAGTAALGAFEPLPEGEELLRYWTKELGGGAARMLAALAEEPEGLSNAELGAAAGISASSGTFSTYLSRLRTLELVEGGRGERIRMSAELT